MTLEEFHKYYEESSDKVFSELNKLNEIDLLELIADKENDTCQIWEGKDNYQVWKVLGTKGTERSIKPLFQIVINLKNDYLIRYHACSALFTIAKINDDNFKGEVQYGLDVNRQRIDQQKAFDKLGNILNEYLASQ